jgi:hypothetical protein
MLETIISGVLRRVLGSRLGSRTLTWLEPRMVSGGRRLGLLCFATKLPLTGGYVDKLC